jgi:hypothetical protein
MRIFVKNQASGQKVYAPKGQAQRLVRVTVSGIFDRRIGHKDHLWMDTN